MIPATLSIGVSQEFGGNGPPDFRAFEPVRSLRGHDFRVPALFVPDNAGPGHTD
jgi:hypothetical protein